MRSRWLAPALLVWVSACGGGAGAGEIADAAFDAVPLRACSALQQDFGPAVAAVPKPCRSAADCAIVGGGASCGCSPMLRCGGLAVNQAAYAGSAAAAIEADFEARCLDADCSSSLECWCDCTDDVADCVDGTCQATLPPHFCNEPPPDAG